MHKCIQYATMAFAGGIKRVYVIQKDNIYFMEINQFLNERTLIKMNVALYE